MILGSRRHLRAQWFMNSFTCIEENWNMWTILANYTLGPWPYMSCPLSSVQQKWSLLFGDSYLLVKIHWEECLCECEHEAWRSQVQTVYYLNPSAGSGVGGGVTLPLQHGNRRTGLSVNRNSQVWRFALYFAGICEKHMKTPSQSPLIYKCCMD